MLAPVLRIVLPLALASALGVPSAHADIYTWVDASGAMNVSNLPPPDDAKVIKVTKDTPPPSESDAQALAQRVRQLEAQVAQGQRPMPPPADYAPPLQYAAPPAQYSQPAPTVVQYFVDSGGSAQYAQPQYSPPQYYAPQYDSTDSWAGNTWCDPNWLNCGWGPYGWASGFYPPSVIVVNNPRRGRPGNGFIPGHRPPIVSPFTTNPVAPLNTSMSAPRPAVAAMAPHRG